MARRNKLQKFSEILSYPNVVENYNPEEPKLVIDDGVEVDFKGRWKEAFFKNDNELILELACGRGEYTLALGADYPDQNFLGVDVKGARIWKGAKFALLNNLTNVGFLRTKIEQIDLFFGPGEVDQIWITFPDPFLGKENRRLTAHSFLDRYKKFLKPGGLVHLKTDDDTLYEFTLDQIGKYPGANLLYEASDIYSEPLKYKFLEYKTYYEIMHLGKGKKIKYIQFIIH